MAVAMLQGLFRFRTWNIENDQFTYPVVELECRNDITVVPRVDAIDLHDYGKRRPDVQHVPHWCSGFAAKSQIKATRRPKNNDSPFSTHVY